MTASLASKLQQAMALLRGGRAVEAEALCREVLLADPRQPDALHLLAMKARGQNQFSEAEKYFRASLESAPRQPAVHANYANMLMSLGRLDEAIAGYGRAVQLDPSFVNGWYNLALALRTAGNIPEAVEVVRRLTVMSPRLPAGWELKGCLHMDASEYPAAREALEAGLKVDPNNARLWYQLGNLFRTEADFQAAAAAYEKARAGGLQSPGLMQNLAEMYYEAGDADKATQRFDEGVKAFPDNGPLHFVRAKFLWEQGQADEHLQGLERSIAAFPASADLWGTYMDLLGSRGDHVSMLKALDKTPAPVRSSLRIRLAEAIAHAGVGNGDEAVAGFESLLRDDPSSAEPRIAFAEYSLKCGDPERANALCADVLEANPHDQAALCFQGTALELMGDPREKWLLDYETMVRPVEVPAPERFPDRAAYFDMVRQELEALHRTEAHPLDQTLRGGTQTNGFLFRLKNPVLQELKGQILKAIDAVLADFPDMPGHPFWGRKGAGIDFQGAWSVRLRSQGYHTNHFHPEGWFSSALYIALPDAVEKKETTQGHIQFGVPTDELQIKLPPKRIVKPEVGKLVLFPSYMWHGTIPFTSEQPRITIAFDFTPTQA